MTMSIKLTYIHKYIYIYTEREREKDNYNQDLLGKYLNNPHIDFKMADARKDAEIYDIESLLLGKKTYIDMLEPTDKYGNTID